MAAASCRNAVRMLRTHRLRWLVVGRVREEELPEVLELVDLRLVRLVVIDEIGERILLLLFLGRIRVGAVLVNRGRDRVRDAKRHDALEEKVAGWCTKQLCGARAKSTDAESGIETGPSKTC